MNPQERAELYERLYFSELDRREKINARLGLPFAVIVATVGLLSYLLHAQKPTLPPWSLAFWILYSWSVVALLAGAWFFRKAWFGATDRLLPTAGHIEEYRRTLLQTYAGYENADELVDTYFSGFLVNYYIECSSDNAINNDRRSFDIFRSTASLTVSVLLAFAAAIPFFIGNHLNRGISHDRTQGSAAASTTASTDTQCSGQYAQACAASTHEASE